ncbi:MAG: trypsin-like peptidase domain-containing protein [Gammaproteobacteria bacterium]|nr:trypsin-like peptidase domain-containing protein [Gammaproteobacteria bacterium]
MITSTKIRNVPIFLGALLLSIAPTLTSAQQPQPVQPQPAQPGPPMQPQPVPQQPEAAPRILPVPEAASPEWSDTLERVSSGVVSIRVDGTRAFDTEWNQSAQATGFVVDAERGLILTNRHVVTPGPVVAEAIFLNNEEVELLPVYRDPIHDFGFFRYDPDDLKFIEPTELKLEPEGARIGREIRVIGNDAGEQLSILAGTIARLDRRAPDYGVGRYNDFNTFYYQAASSTSGGSSGSPVIAIDGSVVALNAGAAGEAASSFFLPLDRVERALRLIQQGEPVTRGTMQTVFVQAPYDELRRLGLSEETEQATRAAFPDETGMLIVQQVVPGSTVAGRLAPGDILIRANSERLTEFIALSKLLDSNVGETVTLDIERGGSPLEVTASVQDLHAITPDEYLEFGDAVVHTLSYQQARHFNTPVEGVYVANPGYVFSTAAIPRGSVIKELNGEPMDNLDDFTTALTGLADGEEAAVRFFSFDDPQTSTLRVIRMDRRWYPAARCKRNDALGYWPCLPLATAGKPQPEEPGTTSFTANGDPRIKALAPSMVYVNFDMPYVVSGVSDRHYYGTGLVVDAERGLVVVDRNTVPVAMGDVRLTFAGSLEIPGRVEYIHPLHNLAVLAYDPRLIGDTPVRPARFNDSEVQPGKEVWVVGLRGDHKMFAQATEVSSIDPAIFPLSSTLRFRESNLETISVVNAPEVLDGVLADEKGRVLSLWSSFAFQGGTELGQVNAGVPAEIVMEMLHTVRADEPLRSLEAEFALLPLASARNLGLDDEWVRRLEKHNPDRRQVLQVTRLVADTPASRELMPGDLLLAVDGEPVSSFREVERAAQKPAVELVLWRNRAEQKIALDTVALDGHGVDRAVMWAGALLQTPHRAMAAQRGIPPEGVYVAYFGFGSPATRYGLYAGRRIVAVDGQPTMDLDSFIEAVEDKQNRESVRLKTITWNGVVEVITLKLDKHYWPAYELELTDVGWERTAL